MTAPTRLPAPERRLTADREVVKLADRVTDELFNVSAELVYQRDDLIEAASPLNNRLLREALQVEGLPPLAREKIQAALEIEEAEERAVANAERRRHDAHWRAKIGASHCELAVFGTRRGRLRRAMTRATQPSLLDGGQP